MHAAPADFALGGEAFAVTFGDVGGFAERLCDLLLITFGVLGPVAGPAGGVDADHAPLPRAPLAKLLADLAGLVDLGDELLALRLVAHRAPAARRRPDGRDE